MKNIKMILVAVLVLLAVSAPVFAEFGLGADVVSRYVWRGTDFGNAASVQPGISYTVGNLEVGAWASYAISSPSADENDLYVSYAIGDLSVTLTDYYFPTTGDVFNYSDEDGIHFLEASVGYGFGSVSLLAGMFFLGDDDNSLYVECGYDFYEKDDVTAGLVVGLGNGMYTVEDVDEDGIAEDDAFGAVNVGLTVSSGSMSASYIINPQAETNFLVFGYSF